MNASFYRQIRNGSWQTRSPFGGWIFCQAPASPSASLASAEILSLASEISEDIGEGFVKRIYELRSLNIALVFSQSAGNEKIKPSHFGGTFTQLTIAPLSLEEDKVEEYGPRAAAETVACDRSCYFLSRGALRAFGREIPEARKGLRAVDPGGQCYVNMFTVSAAIRAARKGDNKKLFLSRRNLWRLTTWGDLSVLPVEVLRALFGGIEARGGDSVLAYTNAWREDSSASPEAREYLKGRAQASVSDAGEALEAIRSGWSVFFPDETSLSLAPQLRAEGHKVKPCTATPQTRHGCSDCLLCDGSKAALITAHKH
jgi:hypothetical protein